MTTIRVFIIMAKLLTFDAANQWLANKIPVPTALSSAQLSLDPTLSTKVRGHAFFSARVTSVNILEQLRSEVQAYTSGATDIATARVKLKTFLSRQGIMPDDVSDLGTGDPDRAITNLASTRRLNLILRQNAAMAHAVGQRQISMHPVIRERWPYYRYDALGDARPTHAALDGMVLPKDSPFWHTHTPPWEFNCRCAIYDADAADAKQYGEAQFVGAQEQPDGTITGKISHNGNTFEVLPNASGYTFRIDQAFKDPNLNAIADGPIKPKLIQQLQTIQAAERTARTIDTIPQDLQGATEFGDRLQPTSDKVGGSTGATVMQDDQGQKWILKNYNGNELQVKNEWLANQLYTNNSINVPEARLAYINGKLHVASRKIDELVEMGTKNVANVSTTAAAQRGFVTDAWLANWDVAGLSYDNILLKPGSKTQIYRIDQGGALTFRAQGAPKGAAFGNTVTELETLRNPIQNPTAARLFSHITDDKIAKQIRSLLRKTKAADIMTIVDSAELPLAEANHLKQTLLARREYLANWEKAYRKRPTNTLTTTQRRVVKDNPREVTEATHAAAPDLTKAERQAVQKFTYNSYKTINRNALAGKPYKELDAAINKLPGYRGLSVRGINSVPNIEEQFAKWQSGDWAYVEWKAYSSTSIAPGGQFSGSDGIVFFIRNNGIHGAYVAPISSVKREAELLMPRNAKFRVIGWAKSPSGDGRSLLLEEVADAIPETQAAPPEFSFDELMSQWRSEVAGNTVYFTALNKAFWAMFNQTEEA